MLNWKKAYKLASQQLRNVKGHRDKCFTELEQIKQQYIESNIMFLNKINETEELKAKLHAVTIQLQRATDLVQQKDDRLDEIEVLTHRCELAEKSLKVIHDLWKG